PSDIHRQGRRPGRHRPGRRGRRRPACPRSRPGGGARHRRRVAVARGDSRARARATAGRRPGATGGRPRRRSRRGDRGVWRRRGRAARGGAGEGRAARARGAEPAMPPPAARRPAVQVAVGEISVENGALGWGDASVTPAARLQFSGLRATLRDVAWPLRGPVQVDIHTGLPGGGTVTTTGGVGVDPISAELHVVSRGADLSPYRPYLPIAAPITGRADTDLSIEFKRSPELVANARGQASLSQLSVLDEKRRLLTVEHAEAKG